MEYTYAEHVKVEPFLNGMADKVYELLKGRVVEHLRLSYLSKDKGNGNGWNLPSVECGGYVVVFRADRVECHSRHHDVLHLDYANPDLFDNVLKFYENHWWLMKDD